MKNETVNEMRVENIISKTNTIAAARSAADKLLLIKIKATVETADKR